MLTTFTKSTHRLVSRRGLNPNAIQPFCRTKENSHATWINSSFLEEIQRPSALNDSIVHAQNRSLVRGEADADQDPSRVLRAALPTPGQPNLRELSFTPCRLPDGGKSNLLSAVLAICRCRSHWNGFIYPRQLA
jgi:hypothetical protein